MAQRRMVSVKIIDSARFIKMPASTQALYFHLLARADDDGVVEAFNVMRMTGAAEDDLKVLTAKDFVKVLNEDLVSYITDWHEHNLIRADRKIDSIYQNLLLKIVGDVDIVEKRERADRKQPILIENGTSQGQPADGIGKVRLGKVSLDKVNKTLVDDAIDFYSRLQSMPKVIKWTDKRKSNINARINDYGIEEVEKVLSLSNCSDFLTGKVESNGKAFIADIDWIMNPNNFIKILEGKYVNKTKSEPNGLTYSNVGLTRDKGMFD